MLKEERQKRILKILEGKEFETVQNLSDELFYSLPTIRRDLTDLEEKGLIKRSHGGAMILNRENDEIPIEFRRTSNTHEKVRLCKKAAELIKDGDVIFLDASSTVFCIIDFIKSFENLTVITNSIQVSAKLSKLNIKTYCTGGLLQKRSLAYAGKYAEEFINNFNVDIMFFSSSAIDDKGNISDYSEEETLLRKSVLRKAKKSVFICDKSKYGKSSTYNLANIKDVTCVISD